MGGSYDITSLGGGEDDEVGRQFEESRESWQECCIEERMGQGNMGEFC